MSTVFQHSWRPPRTASGGRRPRMPFVSTPSPTSLHSCATARTTRSWVWTLLPPALPSLWLRMWWTALCVNVSLPHSAWWHA
eukprot:15802-Pelagococcus_subviridis.AAC.1